MASRTQPSSPRSRAAVIRKSVQEAKETVNSTYREFLKEQGPSKKEEAGGNFIRAIFGKHAIAEDQIL